MAETVSIVITARDEASKVFRNLSGIAGGAFKVAMAGATVGLGAVAAGVGLAISEAMDAEVVLAKLESVIKSTGGAAGVSSEEAQAWADSLSKVTRFSDDTIISTETMLLTFTNIGENVFPQATEMALNMAEMFGGVDQAAIQLGKALNDPIEGVGALKRVGVTFTAEQEAQIKAMMDVNNIAGAQGVIMAELEKEFGGVARAAGSTLSGKFAILKNQLLNVAEAVGTRLLPYITRFVDFVTAKVLPTIDRFGSIFSNLFEAILTGQWDQVGEIFGFFLGNTEKANEVAFGLIDTFRSIADTISGFMNDTLIPFVKEHWEGFRAALIAVGAVLAGAMIVTGIVSIAGALVALLNPVTLIIAGVAALAFAWKENLFGIQDVTKKLWNEHLKPIFEDIAAWLKIHIPIAIQIAKQFWESTLKPALEAIGKFIVEKVIPAIGDFVDWLKVALPSAIQLAKQAWESVFKPALEALWTFVKDTLIPILLDVGAWLEEALPKAFDLAKQAWENVFKPVLEALWGFIKDTLWPILQDVLGWFQDNLPAAFGIIQDAWNNVLKPVFQAMWDFINNNLVPIFNTIVDIVGNLLKGAFQGLIDFWNNIAKPIFDGIKTIIDAIAGAFGTLVDGVQSVIDTINGLIDAASGIEDALPDWLIPGSPTPLELGFRGIAKAMNDVNKTPLFEANMPTQSPLSKAGNGRNGGDVKSNTNYYNLTINSSATTESALNDFNLMKAWGGA